MKKYAISVIIGIALIILGIILLITNNAAFSAISAGVGLILVVNYFGVKAAAAKQSKIKPQSNVNQVHVARQVTHRTLDAVIAVIIFALLLIGAVTLYFRYLGI